MSKLRLNSSPAEFEIKRLAGDNYICGQNYPLLILGLLHLKANARINKRKSGIPLLDTNGFIQPDLSEPKYLF